MADTLFRQALILVILLAVFSQPGLATRLTITPSTFHESQPELNLTCTGEGPSYWAQTIITLEIMKEGGTKPIARINWQNHVTMDKLDGMKAHGHVDVGAEKSYLTLIISKPTPQMAGTYRCKTFFMDPNSQVKEEFDVANVTFEEQDIPDVVANLKGKLSALAKSVRDHNKDHSEEEGLIDTLKNAVEHINETHTQDTQDSTHYHTRQQQMLDFITDVIHQQNDSIFHMEKQCTGQHIQIRHDVQTLQETLQQFNKTNTLEQQQTTHTHTQLKHDVQILQDIVQQFNKTNTLEQQQTTHTHTQLKHEMETMKNKIHDFNSTYLQDQQQCTGQHIQIRHEMQTLQDIVQKQNDTIARQERQLQALEDLIHRLNETNPNVGVGTEKDGKDKTETNNGTKTDNRTKEGCPDGWTPYPADHTCLKAFGTQDGSNYLKWDDAKEFCKDLGGDLVIIKDATKNAFVFGLFANTKYGFPWIGLRNVATSGYEFQYVDGSSMDSYHPWWPGNPRGGDIEDWKCVYMVTRTGDNAGQWVDNYCRDRRPYVCSTSSSRVPGI